MPIYFSNFLFQYDSDNEEDQFAGKGMKKAIKKINEYLFF